jgi:hypothetical protein
MSVGGGTLLVGGVGITAEFIGQTYVRMDWHVYLLQMNEPHGMRVQ